MGLGALGGAISSGLSAVSGGIADLGMAMWQNTQNKKAATKAYEREIDLMNMQNAYNTPAAQMARYKEAGLNPNLIYGQQNLSASASSVPMSKGASVGSAHLEGALNRNFQQQQLDMNLRKLGQDLQLGQAQIEQVQASTETARAQALKSGVDAAAELYNLGFARKRGIPLNATIYEKIMAAVFGYVENAGNRVAKYMWDHKDDFDKDFGL